ncbi:hypothetical protein AKJ57_05175 [candidate division MSBL1 archaeon SCGC-AAA259A05]|uniref:Xylose isomerase-like TIM barrel domain-containing protein n=1 Tax=candidate division MSBL1 archaeon SCGC-AAA259A05 TaxID=1698259 RepID=A0A133U5S4_9EURY|nr:hypothetical protein AKJ57_05175 [candidate division MSBL1 archaeon SCGC-AAA259A05]
MSDFPKGLLKEELEEFDVEVPSWGFERGGTRFETYRTEEDPRSLEERIRAAGRANRITGKGNKVSLHFPWDGESKEDVEKLQSLLEGEGLEAGAVNANLFSTREDSPLDARLRYGSLISPFEDVREEATEHIFRCVEWMRKLESDTLILWIPDGSYSYGQISFYDMYDRISDSLERISGEMKNDEKLLVEYKPFEPAFYATAVFDWGSATDFSKTAGENAKVLVDTGHHLQGGNVEQIVAYLAKIEELGGFHFNDRKYADDDLVTGSLKPGQLFRIFCTLEEAYERDLLNRDDVSFMIDQSHYARDPTEATIESIENILITSLKSKLVDLSELREAHSEADIPRADRVLDRAFQTDVRGALNGWRREKGLPEDPLAALRGEGGEKSG